MEKLRVSYSLLNTWRKGKYDDAIAMYLHKDLPITQAMEDGNVWDTHITEMVDLHKKLPNEFGGDILNNPQTQKKILVPYNDMCNLSILPDILDDNVLWENKSGNSKDSGDYALDFQVPIYLLALTMSNHKIDYAIINHYNQYTNKLDRTLIWNTEEERERARNFIDTLVPEIYHYFQEHGILDKQIDLEYNSK